MKHYNNNMKKLIIEIKFPIILKIIIKILIPQIIIM